MKLRHIFLHAAAAFALSAPLAEVVARADDVSAPEAVRLLAPGRGRRTQLRYALAPGGTARVVFDQKLTTKITTDGFERTEETPQIRYTVALGPFETRGQEFVVPVRVEAIDVVGTGGEPEVAGALERLFAPFVGGRGELRLSGTGRMLRTELLRPSGVTDASWRRFLESFEQLPTPVPLPEEPIAVGARWESKSTTRSQRLPVETTTVYELVARHGSRITVRIAGTQSAHSDRITRGLPPGARATLQAHRGAVGGDGTIDLTLPSFVGTVRIDASMTVDVALPQASSHTVVQTETGVVTEGRRVESAVAAASP